METQKIVNLLTTLTMKTQNLRQKDGSLFTRK